MLENVCIDTVDQVGFRVYSLRSQDRDLWGKHKPSGISQSFFKLPKCAAFQNIWGLGCD